MLDVRPCEAETCDGGCGTVRQAHRPWWTRDGLFGYCDKCRREEGGEGWRAMDEGQRTKDEGQRGEGEREKGEKGEGEREGDETTDGAEGADGKEGTGESAREWFERQTRHEIENFDKVRKLGKMREEVDTKGLVLNFRPWGERGRGKDKGQRGKGGEGNHLETEETEMKEGNGKKRGGWTMSPEARAHVSEGIKRAHAKKAEERRARLMKLESTKDEGRMGEGAAVGNGERERTGASALPGKAGRGLKGRVVITSTPAPETLGEETRRALEKMGRAAVRAMQGGPAGVEHAENEETVGLSEALAALKVLARLGREHPETLGTLRRMNEADLVELLEAAAAL